MAKPGITDNFVNYVRDLRNRGLEFVAGRYYGKYAGTVTNNDDPQGQGRIKVTCKVASGRDDELSLWAYPSSPYAGRNKGFYFPPDIGDKVWVWFDHGDVTQPRYSGSWWLNIDQAKTRINGQIPSEFKTVAGGPTARGIKTGRGHGLSFDDDPTSPTIEMWTGQTDPSAPNGDALRNHQFFMSDVAATPGIGIVSKGGQQTTWNDAAGNLAIKNKTKHGWFLNILDTLNKIQMGGPKNFTFTIDETGQQILLDTPKGFFFHILESVGRITFGGPKGFTMTVDETTGSIIVKTAAGKMVKLDDTGQQILITDGANSMTFLPASVNLVAAAALSAIAAAAVTMSAGAGMTLGSGGPMALNAGGGLALNSPSGAPCVTVSGGVSNNTFVGLKTESLAGGLVQVVVGLWSMVAGIVDIEAPSITIGFGSPKYALVDVRFLDLFNAHLHEVTALGAPSGPPLAPILPGVANTSALAAN